MTDDRAMRVPPHSLDLERAIICAALCDPQTLDLCTDLAAEHFYADSHAKVWASMLRVKGRGLTPDNVTVRDDLVAHNHFKAMGGDEFFLSLTEHIVPTYEPEKHAREVIDLAQRRDVVQVCMQAVSRGYDRANETRAYLEWVQTKVFSATISAREGGKLIPIDPLPTMQRIDEVSRGVTSPMGLSTSVNALDVKSRGFNAGQLWILAGRPGMGKTAMALGAVRAVAREGFLVAVFSLEMTKLELEERYVSLASGVPTNAIHEGRLQAGHVPRITAAVQEMQGAPIVIDDTAGLSVPAMRARLREAVAKSGKTLGLVVVDHIGLAKSGMRTDSREQEVSEIARALKEMAKEFGCTVLALSQLNRECEKSADKRPALHHLRDSGEIEQSADVVVFVYRRGYYAAEKKAGRLQEGKWDKSEIEAGDDDGKAELIIAKRRGGATGTAHCLWEGECTRFVDYGHDDYRPDARVRGWQDEEA